jgi:hypothetical protein
VLFAITFTQTPDRQSRFLEICASAGIPLPLLILPFLLASIPLLFFPIRLAGDGGGPSSSLKALVSLSSLLQKISIFLFVHVVLRILHALSGAAG